MKENKSHSVSVKRDRTMKNNGVVERSYIMFQCADREDNAHCNEFYWKRQGTECPCMSEEFRTIPEGKGFKCVYRGK